MTTPSSNIPAAFSPPPLGPAELSLHGRGSSHTATTAADLLAYPARAARPTSDHDQIVSMAQKWVSQTFFGTLLKQMRDSPFKSDLFSGGRGGQAYSELYDQHLADRMSRGVGRKLADRIARTIQGKRAAAKGGSSGSPGSPAGSGSTSSPPASSPRNYVPTDLRA